MRCGHGVDERRAILLRGDARSGAIEDPAALFEEWNPRAGNVWKFTRMSFASRLITEVGMSSKRVAEFPCALPDAMK